MRKESNNSLIIKSSSLAIAAALAAHAPAYAQSEEDSGPRSAVDVLQDTIVVTATKKAGGQNVQDAPVAITAYGAEQLDAFQLRDISGLSFKMPNVSLDDVATTRGVANFTIRGLGVNSSIPSIDPAVGVFVDGVYLGINFGVILDTFDLASVETLRGPQGVLFGRNVTGGAVLINTQDPTDELTIKTKFAVDSGLRGTGANYLAQGVISGPIIEDVLSAKFGVYYSDDNGWFERYLGGPLNGQPDAFEDFGAAETTLLRGALKFTPDDNTELLVKYEHGETNGDGPAGQSHTNGLGIPGNFINVGRDTFDFSIDEVGFADVEWDHLSAKISIDVGFGDGQITNIFGYRDLIQRGRSDIDASPQFLFHANFVTDHEQLSNEIRYNGRFFDNRLDFTTGFYYFTQDIGYSEQRDLLGGALTQDGGGVQDHRTIGAFVAGEFLITDRLSFNAGLRYSDEEKDVRVASLVANVNAPCFVVPNDERSNSECIFNFEDEFTTNNWSPKVGFGYEALDNLRFYAHWARSFRAGGYNFRNAAADIVNFGPGPFQDERVDSFEIGFKSEPASGYILNGAVFFNSLSDLQREINLADPIAGVVQVIRNTADAEIWGLELDGQAAITDNLILNGSIGYLNGDYTDVIFDLNGDGAINDADLDLDIPRLAPLTGNVGFVYSQEVPGLGNATLNFNYAYRDSAAYTDDNLGTLNEAHRVDASASIDLFDAAAKLTIYGKNLTNNVQFGNDTQLPATLGPVPLGGTFSPLSAGRRVGIELQLEL